MGIFADQAKQMREERIAESKKEANLQIERHKIAQRIMTEFIEDMNNEQFISVSPPPQQGNTVTIKVKTSSNSLTITCHGEDAFTVFGPGNRQLGQGQVLNKVIMARTVLGWLENIHPNGDQWMDEEP
jgi:hypothetical protein